MFKKLELKNFQSWESVKLEFSNGVNVICGLGTSGKSALISRSLKALIDNRPLGGKYFSDFAGKKGEMQVKLTTAEDDVVALTKNVRVNKKGEKVVSKTLYELNGEEKFSGVKDKVPDQIVEKINLSELNRQGQFDQPFLAMSSPGEISRIINRVTRLEKVDEWISRLKSKITANSTKIAVIEDDIVGLEKSIRHYEKCDMEDAERIIQDLVTINNEFDLLNKQVESLEEQIATLEEVENALAPLYLAVKAERYILRAAKNQTQLSEFALFEEQVCKAVVLNENIAELVAVAEKLIDVNNSFIVAENSFVIAERDFTALKEYVVSTELINSLWQKFDVFEYTREAVEILCEEQRNIFEDVIFIEDSLEDLENFDSLLFSKANDLTEVKKDYLAALKTAGKCPVCYQNMDAKHLKKIEVAL